MPCRLADLIHGAAEATVAKGREGADWAGFPPRSLGRCGNVNNPHAADSPKDLE